ncbi:hypothetical protein KH5_06890 [Urechidicola sp. KH5]
MKKTLFIFFGALLFTIGFQAQSFEITPQFGYQINSKLNYNGGYVKLPGGEQYGVTGSFNTGNRINFEFSWTHQDSEIRIKDILFNPYEERNWGDVAINHYLFGAIQDFGNDDQVKPFFGVAIGWSTFNPENNGAAEFNLSSYTTFTFALSGGVKYMFNDYLGFRLQSQLLLPVYGGGVYYGGPYGYAGYSKVAAMLNFSGGLIIAFGDNKTTFN